MCLAIPAQVIEVDSAKQEASVSLGDIRKTVSVALLDAVAPGDYVLIHVGYALEKISPEEAEKTLQLFAELYAEQSLQQSAQQSVQQAVQQAVQHPAQRPDEQPARPFIEMASGTSSELVAELSAESAAQEQAAQ